MTVYSNQSPKNIIVGNPVKYINQENDYVS